MEPDLSSGTITTLEPSVTIVRGELDGTTTYYKIISTSTPGASSLPMHPHQSGLESVGKVQVRSDAAGKGFCRAIASVVKSHISCRKSMANLAVKSRDFWDCCRQWIYYTRSRNLRLEIGVLFWPPCIFVQLCFCFDSWYDSKCWFGSSNNYLQLINGSLHFPNGTIVVPSSVPGEILNNSLSSVMNPSLLNSHPTMVSVSIPGGVKSQTRVYFHDNWFPSQDLPVQGSVRWICKTWRPSNEKINQILAMKSVVRPTTKVCLQWLFIALQKYFQGMYSTSLRSWILVEIQK